MTNFEKTCIYRLGVCKNSDFKPKTRKKFKWADTGILALGVLLDHQSCENYSQLFDKTEAILNKWKHRSISLIGKVTIINSLVASLFVYKMQVLPLMLEKELGKFNQLITDFIWNGRKPKIKLEYLQNLKQNFGLRLVNLQVRDIALKNAWVKRSVLKDRDDTVLMLAKYHIKPQIIFSEFWRLNFSCKHVDAVCNSHGFWHSVIIAWTKYNYHEVEDIQDIIAQRLWGNSQILVGNKPIFNKNLIEKGIFTVLDLYDNQKGHLRTYQDTCDMYGNVNFLDYLSILSAIPYKWKKAIACLSPSILDISFNMTIDKMLDTEKISKKIYENLLEQNPSR